ncbi:hypothetical protein YASMINEVIRUS_1414 [Yasminevirus sp. GU-2018]|uniref:Microbial-type PARG catalytic domain-containing protein n=1 Tax=Yasminevirus sp. GU-2018 TaxID=2420051 RepID=A0A5K0UB99_9VIRU|nr:hypothetical protein YASMINEVIRUS_1414 [Yasminevirus sp. GU-2018]
MSQKIINIMEITKEDSFECVMRLIREGHRPVVLDHASGTNPGGGWKPGKVGNLGTQEESLCRRSDLGLLLAKKKYPIPTDGLHYVMNVSIHSDLTGTKLVKPVKCCVIASELRSISERSDDYLTKRVSALYEVALANSHDVIVLGAWGLGAFRETPEDGVKLAKCMKECAKKYNGRIKTVFALYGSKINYETFKSVCDA